MKCGFCRKENATRKIDQKIFVVLEGVTACEHCYKEIEKYHKQLVQVCRNLKNRDQEIEDVAS